MSDPARRAVADVFEAELRRVGADVPTSCACCGLDPRDCPAERAAADQRLTLEQRQILDAQRAGGGEFAAPVVPWWVNHAPGCTREACASTCPRSR